MSFIAQHPGKCKSCHRWFAAGSEVAYDDELGVVHAPACPPDLTKLQREVCPRCFIERPVNGVCECGS